MFVLLMPILSLAVVGQTITYGALAGANLNLVRLGSDHDIVDNTSFKLNPAYAGGAFVNFKYNRKNILTSLEYERISNTTNFVFTDIAGNPVGKYNASFINIQLTYDIIGLYEVFNELSIGTGVSVYFVADSKVKFPKDIDFYAAGSPWDPSKDIFAYRRLNIAIPILVRYEANKLFFFSKLSVGVINRLYNHSIVKEYNNTLTMGLGVYLGSKSVTE